MTTTLIIRHLCGDLEKSEREDFLKHFGAERVWFIKQNSHTAFAAFKSKQEAEEALIRLHQLEILGKRLTVEFADDKQAEIKPEQTKQTEIECFKQFLNTLNSTDSSLDFNQPPPPNLTYKYPPPNACVLFNILYELTRNLQFYVQTLHLMNKMNLDPPFADNSNEVKAYIKRLVSEIKGNGIKSTNDLSSDESEMSCEEIEQTVVRPVKRRKTKQINRKNILKQAAMLSDQPNKKIIHADEVFDLPVASKQKRIEINVNSSVVDAKLIDDVEPIGFIGKIDPPVNNEAPNESKSPVNVSPNTIPLDEIVSNRISAEDMKILPVFKNYNPGAPSMRLYIKNLAKGVTVQDIESIYRRYVESEDAAFDVRVMQEGRMKGQAFVTLPSVEASQTALEETNGFIFKDKPMVVQFARTANK